MDMLVRIVTIACLVILSLELLAVLVNTILKKRPQRIAFLRSFKKGKCAIIYVTAIPLYFVGHLYAGQDLPKAFFNAISKIINLVVLKYDVGSVEALMNVDPLYRFTIYFCFVLVGCNAVILTLSLITQHVWCAVQTFKATVTRRDKLFLFGNNRHNVSIYKSDKRRSKTVIDRMDTKACERLYLDGVSYISVSSFENAVRRLFGLVKRLDREYVVVVNTGEDEQNIQICRMLIDSINGAPEQIKSRLFLKMKVYVFGDPRYEAIYGDIVSSGLGCIHYVNKYQKIAVDFIDRYPFTKFMDETQIDYETSLVREDVDINVLLIGFGKTNQQIFLTSVANNQFLTAGEGDPVLKKVKYFIFDKNEAENNKNLNHNYYRYKYECAGLRAEDYLPLPTLPAEETYYRLDVNDHDFYNRIRQTARRSPKDVTFAVIAFGTDLENIDMAQKLVEKRKEWELDNLVIFVKVRAWRKEQTLLENEGCYFIGNERDVVYDIDKIVGDKMFRMAQMRNEVYDLEYDITHGGIEVSEQTVKENHAMAYWIWYVKKSQMERESSMYGCLSLRSKLNLRGLDYCEAAACEGEALSEEEYLLHYAGDDMPDRSKYSVTAGGKPIVSYTLDFKDSRRRNMAIHEHQRWNSFMISKGMIPASRERIATETAVNEKGETRYTNGKNYAVRRHGNLTTFEGLVEYRRMIAARDGVSEAEKDVIKYDYQLLDDAYWLLSTNGYHMIKKQRIE